MGVSMDRRRWLAAGSALLLGGCTTYRAAGSEAATGYRNEKMGEGVYRVTFKGDGRTSGEQVWGYWLYRCAELTLENGYDAFLVRQLPANANTSRVEPAPGEEGAHEEAAYHFIYIPGYTITTYSMNSQVRMLHLADVPRDREVVGARPVVSVLGDFVRSNGRQPLPSRAEVTRVALVRGQAAGGSSVPTDRGSPKTTMEDLRDLLPAR